MRIHTIYYYTQLICNSISYVWYEGTMSACLNITTLSETLTFFF